jgi:serine/threonine-protein kinase
VSVNGIGRVTDFGIAKAAARITTTRVGQVKGKLAYMSPEQAKGRPLDHRTDLWAMGVVIWEQLTGARLFKVENESETYKRVLDAPIPRLRELIPQTPPEVDAVIARALERDVNKRWPSAREMVTALERAARATELLADAHETGEYIRNSFQAELTLRRAAIRQAASQKSVEPGKGTASLPGGLVVPQLPEHSVSLTVSPPPGPPPVALPQPGSDEYEESMDTIVVASEPARDIDDMSTFKVNPAQNSPAVQKALQHARAVMASPGAPAPQAGPTRRASGSMSAVAASNPPPRTAGDPAAHDAGASNPAPSIFAGPHMPTVQLDSVPRGPQAPVASVTPAPTSVAAPSASRRTPVGLWITVGIVAALGATVVAGLQLGWFPFAARAGRAADSASGSPPAPTPQRPTTPSGAHLPIPPPSNVVAHGPVVSGDAAAPAPSAPDAASTAAPTLAGPDASHAASITDAAGTLAPTAPPAIPAPTNAPAPSSPNPPANVHHHHGRDGGSGHGAMIEVPPA